MARLRAVQATGGEIALSAATARTIIQLAAATNTRIALKSFGFFFDGTSSSNEPVRIDLMRQSSAGTASAATPASDMETTPAETIQTSGRTAFTVEPTYGNVLRSYNCHPQAGFERSYAMDEEIIVPGGGRLALRLTAPANVNVAGFMCFEE